MKRFKLAFISLTAAAVFCSAAFAVPIENVKAQKAMVSSAHSLASQAGAEILEKGGNAIDAAVATSLALNVVEPKGSGIGGGGFMTISLANGEKICVDYISSAPKSTKIIDKSLKASDYKRPVAGGKTVCTPGFVKGMEYVLKTYGTMTFAQVAEPAIRLAEEGFEFHESQNAALMDYYEKLERFNDLEKVPFFEEGMPVPGGAIVKQHALARAFRLIGEKGSDAFYKGEIADAIVKTVNSTGGNFSKSDLARYAVIEREPLVGTYRDCTLYTMPPCSSGGATVLELLNVLENFDLSEYPAGSAKYANLFIEASRLANADRRKYLADPDFADVPIEGLISKEFAKSRAEKIVPGKAARNVISGKPHKYRKGGKKAASYIADFGDEQCTTSLSVVDGAGNIVTATNTINHFWGSCVYVPEFGFFLNNAMVTFAKDPNSVNAQAPNKRSLSTMSPTIIFDASGKPFMSIGSAGAARIITAIAQTIINVIDRGMSMDEAIEQVRYHCKEYTTVQTDPDRGSKETAEQLEKMGYTIEYGYAGAATLGAVQAIRFTPDGLEGGSDSRRLGAPVAAD